MRDVTIVRDVTINRRGRDNRRVVTIIRRGRDDGRDVTIIRRGRDDGRDVTIIRRGRDDSRGRDVHTMSGRAFRNASSFAAGARRAGRAWGRRWRRWRSASRGACRCSTASRTSASPSPPSGPAHTPALEAPSGPARSLYRFNGHKRCTCASRGRLPVVPPYTGPPTYAAPPGPRCRRPCLQRVTRSRGRPGEPPAGRVESRRPAG
jgi:hypothetical protein